MVIYLLNKFSKIVKVYDYEFILEFSWVIFYSKGEVSNGLDGVIGSKKEYLFYILFFIIEKKGLVLIEEKEGIKELRVCVKE